MDLTAPQQSSETAPLKSKARSRKYYPIGLLQRSFGTRYFLISSGLAALIPVAQLAVGMYYIGQCPIDQRINTYTLVAGASGVILGGLSILIAVAFMYLIPDIDTLSSAAKFSIYFNALLMVLLSLFSFVWFFVGCVLILNALPNVQFNDPTKPNYCQSGLYKGSFVLLILTVIWFFLQCCLECFRQCCVGRSD